MLPISLHRGKVKTMEVAWARQQNDTDVHHNYPSKEWHVVDPRQKKEGMTERDVEEIRGGEMKALKQS